MLRVVPRPVLRLFAITIVARTPFAAVGLLLIIRTKELTGSYAASGLVAGAGSIAVAISSPWVGRLVDRRGQTTVLRVAGVLSAAAIATFALLPDGVPLGALVACAAVAGAATPPIGACMRTLYPTLLQGDALHRVYALESAALELTYIVGPVLMLAIASAAGTATALIAAAAALSAGTLVFSATRESRGWRDAVADGARQRGGALRSPGLQTIVIAVGLAGATFGAVEVAVAAACQAAGAKGATGVLLAVWGLGSMLGGFAAARSGAPADAARWLALLLAALGLGDLALVPIASPAALAPILLVAGAAVAPLLGTAYTLVDRVAPAGGATEAFAWLTTAIGIGLAGGSALAGALVDAGGAGAGFAAAAAAGLVACAITSARRASLATPGTVPSVA
jgi:predicted MFS family arabinose efflux permease